ncbi:MAG: hypothetical protein KA978_31630 [Deltaproteobacteria bacterium]|nr:hypothetical protein [Deltaproteobacteria bacterium]
MRRGGWRCVSMLLLALGCSGDEVDPFAGPVPSQCPSTPMERSLVVTRMRFVKATMPGVVDGFDLDGRVSRNDDAASCRRVDFTSPDGTTGIDNQLSLLVPVLETQTAGALDEAVQAAINSGQLLLSMSIEGLDDRRDDPCVQLVFRQLRGMPFVGSDHRLDPGQTFETARDQPVSRVTGRMRDGVIEAGPFPLALPVAVLDARFVLNLHNARIRLRWRSDDTFDGMVGGGIPADELIAIVQTLGIPQELRSLVARLVNGITDLDPDADGNCRRFSSALSFEGRGAFVNP